MKRVPPKQINTVNKYLNELGRKYHDLVPLSDIMVAMRANGLTLLQEDGTEWSGFLCGEDSNATIQCADLELNPVHRWLSLSWYRMPSGRYEVTAYVS